jgi:DNA-binding CsgD family transcriptional regulator
MVLGVMAVMDLSSESLRKVLSVIDEISHKEPDVMKWLSCFEKTFGYSQSLYWSCDKNLSLTCTTSHNIDKRAIEEYDQYYHKMDLLAPKVAYSMLRERHVLRLLDLVPAEAYEKNPYYYEYMAKYKHHHLMTMYLVSGHQVLGLIDFIRPKNEPPFSDQDVMKLEILSRFLSQRLESFKHSVPVIGQFSQLLLTPKEMEVLDHVRKGYSNDEISAQLHISINTVKTHLLNLYRKTGVSNRTELSYKFTS